jgi:2-oxoglutarate ferredoxin oxidoreductase subunit delta
MSSEAPSKQETPVEIEVVKAWCKGCAICVEFCPTDVLEMQNGIAAVVKPEDCTRCQLCDMRCPDFAINVR